MLSAQQQKMSEEPPPDHSSSPASGFGKVLTSLQGLQQRLDDFSVEDVSRAHSQAVQLIQQLGELKARLQRLHRLHRVFGFARAAIKTMARNDVAVFDTDTDGLEKHPILRAIVRAGKFIEMHPHLLAARTNPNYTESKKSETGDTHSLIAVAENSESATGWPDDRFHPPANAEELSSDAIVRNDASPIALPVSYDYDFAELKLDDVSVTAMKSETNTGSSGSKKPRGFGAFDERLLNDLIETYGEFAASETSTAGSRPSPPAPFRKEDPTTEPSTPEQLKKEASTALAAEPIFVKPCAEPEGPWSITEQEPVAPTSNQSAPKANPRGELDQQLKNIIKDYGEVDLYSRGKSVNTNIRVIAAAAAALLILVLAAFFFFKTPSSSSPASRRASTAEPFMPSAASVNDAAQKN